MTVSVMCIYFFTVILLAVTGSENKQVSGIYMLIITAQLTWKKNLFICILHSLILVLFSGFISKQFWNAYSSLLKNFMKEFCFLKLSWCKMEKVVPRKSNDDHRRRKEGKPGLPLEFWEKTHTWIEHGNRPNNNNTSWKRFNILNTSRRSVNNRKWLKTKL